jgi:hypothetical protein
LSLSQRTYSKSIPLSAAPCFDERSGWIACSRKLASGEWIDRICALLTAKPERGLSAGEGTPGAKEDAIDTLQQALVMSHIKIEHSTKYAQKLIRFG